MDFKTALTCANFSQDIYRINFSKPESFAGEGLLPASAQLLQDEDTDTQFVILDTDAAETVIVFRGSENDRDWDINLQIGQKEQEWVKKAKKEAKKAFRKEMKEVAETVVEEEALVYPEEYGEPSRPVKMHQGFIGAYLSVRDRIHQYVEGSSSRRYRITGHSLGGAIATLCAVDLQYNFGREISIEAYTFGSPRVGNGAFTDSYNQRVPDTWRVVHGWDAVVGLPVPWQGYRHVDTAVKLARDFTWKIITGSFNDHKIGSYISALEKQIDKQLER